jgi:hypothetical protein
MRTHSVLPPDANLQQSPSFTLGTALVLLGHNCTGLCPSVAVKCRADVWFIHLSEATNSAWTTTLVDVEFAAHEWPESRSRELVSRVNDCLRADHIRVRARSTVQRGLFLAALDARRAARSTLTTAGP